MTDTSVPNPDTAPVPKAVLPAPRSVTSIWPAVAILLFAAACFYFALGYKPVSQRFPMMVSVALFALGLIDLWSRTRLPGHRFIGAFWGTDFTRREMGHNPGFGQELALLGWILACFAGIAAFGILPVMPLFCVAYIKLRAGLSLKTALLVGAIVLAFEFIVFEWLLDFPLYRGLLFTTGGLDRW